MTFLYFCSSISGICTQIVGIQQHLFALHNGEPLIPTCAVTLQLNVNQVYRVCFEQVILVLLVLNPFFADMLRKESLNSYRQQFFKFQ